MYTIYFDPAAKRETFYCPGHIHKFPGRFAVFAIVLKASSQAAAACGEADHLKYRTPIINNYFLMTVLKLGLSFTCIRSSPESLNEKNTYPHPLWNI